MALLPILVDEHPILRRKAHKITQFDAALKKQANDMFETMRVANGIGLAANQVGSLLRIIVVELTPHPEEDRGGSPAVRIALCNPEILSASGRQVGPEACLSLPGWIGEVPRAEKVTVRAQTLEGKRIKINADGLYARCLQHEIDHLDGVLFPDRVEDLKTLRKLSPREAEEHGGEVESQADAAQDEGHLVVTPQG
jgi:peptide deformylase